MMKHSCILGIFLLIFVADAQIRFPSHGNRYNIPKQQSPRPRPPTDNLRTSGCNCLEKSKCGSGLGQENTACVAEGGGKGICCIAQSTILTRVGFSAQDSSPVSISQRTVAEGLEAGREDVNALVQDDRRRLRNREFLRKGDPARGHSFFFQRSQSARQINNLALTIAKASEEVAERESLSPQQSFSSLPQTRIGEISTRRGESGFECPLDDVPRCDPNAKFRTIDGTCNNLRKPLLGRSETAFGRIKPALYEDGIMSPKITGVDGEPLPNVRVASNTILIDIDQPSPQFTLAVMQWAQFADHDLTHAPFADLDGEGIQCCRNGQIVNPQPEQCFVIEIPADDAFYGPRNQRCINFVRSLLALNEGCALGPVEQLNALTHWYDGSMIYGSTEEEHGRVADRATGFMKTSAGNLPPLNRTLDCDARDRVSVCMAGGDSRINEQPALTTEHTVWVREHNRIAKALQTLNPRWSGEKLFEETRRIVGAVVQHINFDEWLPIIIGDNLWNRLNLKSLSSGYKNSYNPNIDPRMSNEFATAAFRFGHSLVQGLFRLISTTGRQSRARLRDTFNAPGILQRNPALVDAFVRGLTTQSIQNRDSFITQDLSNHLFQTPEVDFGMDLMSLNIQRGREHAISTYNQMREEFGIGKASNFLDLLSTTPSKLIERIQSVYRNVDDIDLWIGGMTEKNIPGALLGPTFANIIAKQFQDVMNGDRFFYEFGGQPGSFTPEQLQEIRKSSIAKVYCDNTNLETMQKHAFRSVSQSNPRVPCSSLPSMNLRVFS